MADLVIAVIRQSSMAWLVAVRSSAPSRHPSPKNCPAVKIPTTASLPCSDNTVIFTLPFWMKKTLRRRYRLGRKSSGSWRSARLFCRCRPGARKPGDQSRPSAQFQAYWAWCCSVVQQGALTRRLNPADSPGDRSTIFLLCRVGDTNGPGEPTLQNGRIGRLQWPNRLQVGGRNSLASQPSAPELMGSSDTVRGAGMTAFLALERAAAEAGRYPARASTTTCDAARTSRSRAARWRQRRTEETGLKFGHDRIAPIWAALENSFAATRRTMTRSGNRCRVQNCSV